MTTLHEPYTSRFDFDVATESAFQRYHAENPQIYRLLLRFALEAKQAGRIRLGIKMLYERVRWHTTVETHGDEFKLNNNYHAYYARLLMQQEPTLRGFFETRKAKADTIV